jgi:hypothetical protein
MEEADLYYEKNSLGHLFYWEIKIIRLKVVQKWFDPVFLAVGMNAP